MRATHMNVQVLQAAQARPIVCVPLCSLQKREYNCVCYMISGCATHSRRKQFPSTCLNYKLGCSTDSYAWGSQSPFPTQFVPHVAHPCLVSAKSPSTHPHMLHVWCTVWPCARCHFPSFNLNTPKHTGMKSCVARCRFRRTGAAWQQTNLGNNTFGHGLTDFASWRTSRTTFGIREHKPNKVVCNFWANITTVLTNQWCAQRIAKMSIHICWGTIKLERQLWWPAHKWCTLVCKIM